MYLVKYEIIATSIKAALYHPESRNLYAIEEADPKTWPIEKKKLTGFNSKKNV